MAISALSPAVSALSPAVLAGLAAAGIALAAPLIACNEEHRFLVLEQLRETGIAPGALLLEPVGRNTAPALTLAALVLTLCGLMTPTAGLRAQYERSF